MTFTSSALNTANEHRVQNSVLSAKQVQTCGQAHAAQNEVEWQWNEKGKKINQNSHGIN